MIRIFILATSVSTLALAACAEDDPNDLEAMDEDYSAETDSGLATANQSMTDAGAERRRADAEARMAGGMDAGQAGGQDGLQDAEGYEAVGGEPEASATAAIENAAEIVSGFTKDALDDYDGDAEAYVRNVQLANLYLMQAGRVAAERSGEAEIRALGEDMAQTHQTQLDALRAALDVSGLGMEPPRELDAERLGLLEDLRDTSDTSFAAVFMGQQEAIYPRLNALHDSYGDDGVVEALTAYAQDAAELTQARLDRLSSDHGAALAPD